MSNLLEKASIVTTPTAYNDGKLLSVKPNTSVGDFDFTRNSSATRVASNGLIEDVASGLPRIDYTGGVGHLLFEPSTTNTATYSNDFTQGDIFIASADPSIQNTVLTSQQATSPDGTNNAWKLVDNNDGLTGQTGFTYFGATLITNNYNTISYFVKKQGSNNFVYIASFGFDSGANGQTYFNIQNGTLGVVSANHTANIQNYGNGWYRISITNQTVTDVVGAFALRLATSNGSGNILRDGTNGIYLFGVQAESDANRQFMTSYIPTNGSTVTRLADAANGAGSSDLINSTEGVLYTETACLADGTNNRAISVSSDNSNYASIQYNPTSNRILGRYRNAGSFVSGLSFDVADRTQFSKIAFRYKQDDFALFVNGVKVATDTSGNVLPADTFTSLNFSTATNQNPFQGKAKCVAVFKEALTDAELTCLTTI